MAASMVHGFAYGNSIGAIGTIQKRYPPWSCFATRGGNVGRLRFVVFQVDQRCKYVEQPLYWGVLAVVTH